MYYRADLINQAMGRERLTNERLADKAGVTPKVVSAIRNGKVVTIQSLHAVAGALDLTLSELFAESGAKTALTQ